MAIEPRRGCGYRKAGGLYLISAWHGRPCGKLPLECTTCPTCGAGIKPARGWTWIDPAPLFAGRACHAEPSDCQTCPLDRPWTLGPIGLIWVGEKFYRTPEIFQMEASRLGISRRISAVPKGFVVGETWVALAHRYVHFNGDAERRPGIFRLFRPERIEKIVTETEAADADEMAKLRARGITPFVVPDNDPDHGGSASDNGHDDGDLFD